ncbi:DUF1631 family protein [Marinobacter fonticola]|uniref:DUF1631 family protein n=1 Tax=Marinobacter fonticola TaxID=2603215 RepID=UPI0011E7A943|nr:DUF1631 family protein [Marinobacter fonticola]
MVHIGTTSAGDAQPNLDIIQAILKGIRVPDLPYPVTRPSDEAVSDWVPLLHTCWQDQRDERVVGVLGTDTLTWSVRQVNAAYLADRIMDVFLQKSGLHSTLVKRTARLRFLLAWQIHEHGAEALGGANSVHNWIDSLHTLRGWSDSGGRAARQLMSWLDTLVQVVDQCFVDRNLQPFERFAEDWRKEQEQKDGRIDRLRQRLLETEQGAARQRTADKVARALVGRALGKRELPPAVTTFIDTYWLPLLRQAVWAEGMGSDNARHAAKLLEWMIWVSDPKLSDQDRDKLYHVGEQLGDKIGEVWSRVNKEALPESALQGIEVTMVARLRGTPVDLEPVKGYSYDSAWLDANTVPDSEIQAYQGHWFVEGEGQQEQRLYFFALLSDSNEVLWTNGEGVKLGLMDWIEFRTASDEGRLRSLPELNHFADVVSETVKAMEHVLRSQIVKRREAREKAEAQAAKVRAEREAAEKRRQEEEQRREAEAAEARAAEEAAVRAQEVAEQQRLEKERLAVARAQVDGLKLGSWIAVSADTPENGESAEARKLKLAVRLNATGKLIFVDRLGLNRTEMTVDSLIEAIVKGEARVMSSEAEFEDTLSRVVGRIRVGRS